MNSFLLFFVGWFFLLSSHYAALSQNNYLSHRALSEQLNRLARAHPTMVKIESLTTTDGGKDIWLLSVGSGDLSSRPAIAIVGGVSGDLLTGTELAVRFASHLLNGASGDQRIKALLDSVTFYILPDMSPDAREQYFASVRYERLGNANPSDLDRDGSIGEDPYNDLNGDGLITLMRIKDPTGAWMKHPEDARVMIKAQPEKGRRGEYLVYSEGIDMDKDGQFNEDGEEGVFFNRNFTFKYPAFTRGAGEHAVSEKETRAIADFLFGTKNVFAVISFGPANNLSEPVRYNEREAAGRIPTAWLEKDVTVSQMVSHVYNSIMKEDKDSSESGNNQEQGQQDALNDAGKSDDQTNLSADQNNDSQPGGTGTMVRLSGGKGVSGSDGDFFQWAYFHYGRFSFSTPGWWVPAPESNAAEGREQRRQPAEQDQSAELAFLRWAEKNNVKDVFVPWTRVDHPDFPGKEVEVGGIKPFAMKNPPHHLLDFITEKHAQFILEVAEKRPQTDIVNLKTEALGNNLFRVTADIANRGDFPAVSQLGQRNRWVQKVVIRGNPANEQQLVSGNRIEVIDVIDGRSSIQRSWLIRGRGDFSIRAGSESTGFREITVKL